MALLRVERFETFQRLSEATQLLQIHKGRLRTICIGGQGCKCKRADSRENTRQNLKKRGELDEGKPGLDAVQQRPQTIVLVVIPPKILAQARL